MEGTIRIVVNLRSRSVEYTGEVGEDRYGCTLKGDPITAEEILSQCPEDLGPISDSLEKLELVTSMLISEAKACIGVSTLSIDRHGNQVTIHPDDISFITFIKTGVFKEIGE